MTAIQPVVPMHSVTNFVTNTERQVLVADRGTSDA